MADFWWWMTVACLAWYSTITVYVSIRGVRDIKSMLARLDTIRQEQAEDEA